MRKKIIILVILAGVLAIVYFNYGEKVEFISNNQTKIIDILELEDSKNLLENQKIYKFKDSLVVWNNGDFKIHNLKDDQIYHMPLNVENPIITIGEEFIYVANPEEGIIYYLDEKAEMVERIDLSRRIFNIEEISQHLIYHIKEENMESIGIINSKGQNIMRYDYEGESILSYCYRPNEKKLIVALLNLEAEGIGSRLDIYENLENKKEIFFKDEIIVDINIMKLGNVFVLTDNKLYYLSDLEIVWEKDIEFLKDFQIIGKDVYLLSGASLEVIDTKGEVKKSYIFEGDYDNFQIFKDGLMKEKFILYKANKIGIYEEDKEILTQDISINKLFTIDDRIYIVGPENLGIYKLGKMEIEVEDE